MAILLSKDGYFREVNPDWDNGNINGYFYEKVKVNGIWEKCPKGYVALKTSEFVYDIYVNLKDFKELNPYMYGFDFELKNKKIIGDVIIVKKKMEKIQEFKIKELLDIYKIYRPVINITPKDIDFGLKGIALRYFYYPKEKQKFKVKIKNRFFKEYSKKYIIYEKSKWIVFKHKTKPIKFLLVLKH